VKEKLYQYFPNIHKFKESEETIRKHLAEARNQVWAQDIEGEFLQRLWVTLPSRVASVLDVREWYKKY